MALQQILDKKAFAKIRQEIETFDALREEIIAHSRVILKQSKASIYALHRNENTEALAALGKAKQEIGIVNQLLKKEPELASVGAYSEALEEYVEAACYHGFVSKRCLPTPEQLNVPVDVYLPGLCDMVGELVRKAVNSAIAGDSKTALEIKDFVSAIYDELMLFDFRNIPVRKKFDSIKYSLEHLENLALQLKLKQGK